MKKYIDKLNYLASVITNNKFVPDDHLFFAKDNRAKYSVHEKKLKSAIEYYNTLLLVQSLSTKIEINSSEDAYNYIKSLGAFKDRERWGCVFLDIRNRPIGEPIIYCVGVDKGVYIDNRSLIKDACVSNASGIITFHNHPSGNLDPSDADIDSFNQTARLLKIMYIKYLDNLIITENGHYSFADNGHIS